jgi:hypothetical protein
MTMLMAAHQDWRVPSFLGKESGRTCTGTVGMQILLSWVKYMQLASGESTQRAAE